MTRGMDIVTEYATFFGLPVGDRIFEKGHFEQMMKDLVEEAERWEPMLASLWWSSTYAKEIKENTTMETERGRHKFPF